MNKLSRHAILQEKGLPKFNFVFAFFGFEFELHYFGSFSVSAISVHPCPLMGCPLCFSTFPQIFELFKLLGAALIDWLDAHVDFPNGIYFAFLCLTAIEYGKLIPTE